MAQAIKQFGHAVIFLASCAKLCAILVVALSFSLHLKSASSVFGL
jgi:hypothetical protein